MHRSLLPVPLFLLSLASACDSGRLNDDTGGEMAWNPCTYTTSVVGLEEVTPLGFSAADLMAVVGGPRAEVLEWLSVDGEPEVTTDLAFEVSYSGGEIRYVDAEPREGGDTGGMEYELGEASECPDTLEMDVTFTFSTADGAFDESVDALLYAYDLETGHVGVEIPYDDLAGAYVPQDASLDPGEWDHFAVWVSAEIASTSSLGRLGVQGDRVEGETATGFQGVEAVWPPGTEPW